MTEYEIVSELAVRMAKVTTRGNIINGDSWKPLTLLYEQFLKEKDFIPLRYCEDLDKYKKETMIFKDDRVRRVFVMQGLYMYDLMKEK